jgi:hypothetical protein
MKTCKTFAKARPEKEQRDFAQSQKAARAVCELNA